MKRNYSKMKMNSWMCSSKSKQTRVQFHLILIIQFSSTFIFVFSRIVLYLLGHQFSFRLLNFFLFILWFFFILLPQLIFIPLISVLFLSHTLVSLPQKCLRRWWCRCGTRNSQETQNLTYYLCINKARQKCDDVFFFNSSGILKCEIKEHVVCSE